MKIINYFIDTERTEQIGDKELIDHQTRTGLRSSLYQYADEAEQVRIFEGGENSLDLLAQEISIRLYITKSEIFKIGELLIIAKKRCQQEKKRFKQWIADNCEFSYETAVNFMNVFKYCFGWKPYALRIPTSILYQIAAPSFSEELRTYLFDKGNIETITNGQFKKLVDAFNKGGIEAIEENIMELNRSVYVYRQSEYTLDQCKKCLVYLEGVLRNMENRPFSFETQIEFYEPASKSMRQKLHTSIKESINLVTIAIDEATEIRRSYIESFRNKVENLH